MIKNKHSLLHAKITDCDLETQSSQSSFLCNCFVYLITPRGLPQHLPTNGRYGGEEQKGGTPMLESWRPVQTSTEILYFIVSTIIGLHFVAVQSNLRKWHFSTWKCGRLTGWKVSFYHSRMLWKRQRCQSRIDTKPLYVCVWRWQSWELAKYIFPLARASESGDKHLYREVNKV